MECYVKLDHRVVLFSIEMYPRAVTGLRTFCHSLNDVRIHPLSWPRYSFRTAPINQMPVSRALGTNP